jgi:hypothetical protein
MASALAVYFACFVPHRLAAGERGMVLVLSASVEQSRVCYGYCLAFLQESPVLRREILEVTRNEIRLKNGIIIAIHTNSFRTSRGRTTLGIIFDETAWWRDDTTSQPDVETYRAIMPSLVRPGGTGMLISISSPYRKTGLLHTKHKLYFGVDADDVLCVQAPTVVLNPSLTESDISAQRQADPTAARSEWDAEFRADLVGFLDDASIDAAVDRDRPPELPPRDGVRYAAFVDPAGGASGGDAYALCIGHREHERVVVDGIWARRGPFHPKNVTAEYAAICKCYRISTVVGDKYAREWVIGAWRESGIHYENSDLTASELFLESLPLFTRGLISLPNHPALLRELRLLERIPGRNGKDQVAAPRNVHDDLANVCCACAVLLTRGPGVVVVDNALLGRIMRMEPRRNMGSARRSPALFLPPMQRSIPDSWNPELRRR